jgi:hypothetical protein
VAILFAVLLLLIVGVRFAQPIEDGDIFWHMIYGSQMVEHGPLRVGHSLFSWTPASNEMIYCAWTGELLFLAVWKAFGIAGASTFSPAIRTSSWKTFTKSRIGKIKCFPAGLSEPPAPSATASLPKTAPRKKPKPTSTAT